MPFPSLGCLTCKERRVKCDETHPTCRKCAKGSRQCVYDEGLSTNGRHKFKSENLFAAGTRQRRPREKTAKLSHDGRANSDPQFEKVPSTSLEASIGSAQELDRSGNKASGSQVHSRDVITIAPSELRLKVPLETHALAHYAMKYCASPQSFPEIADGHAKHVLPVYYKAAADSPINLAIRASALASFGIVEDVPIAITKAQRLYQRTLEITKGALVDPQQLTSDGLLVTVMALSHYEGMAHRPPDFQTPVSTGPGHGYRQPRSWSHHAGAVSLLKLRQALNMSAQERDLDRTVRRGLIKTALLREEPIPPSLVDGSKFGEVGFGLAVDDAMIRVASLRARAGQLLAVPVERAPNIPDINAIIQGAHSIDALLCGLTVGLSKEWAYSIEATIPSKDAYYGSRAYVYKSLGHAAIWNRCRSLRILVNDTLIRLYEHLEAGGQHLAPMLIEAARAKIQMLLKDVCASIPQYFGHVVASESNQSMVELGCGTQAKANALSTNLLTFSLLISVTAASITDGQRKWLKDRLADVCTRVNKSILGVIAARP